MTGEWEVKEEEEIPRELAEFIPAISARQARRFDARANFSAERKRWERNFNVISVIKNEKLLPFNVYISDCRCGIQTILHLREPEYIYRSLRQVYRPRLVSVGLSSFTEMTMRDQFTECEWRGHSERARGIFSGIQNLRTNIEKILIEERHWRKAHETGVPQYNGRNLCIIAHDVIAESTRVTRIFDEHVFPENVVP
ncbi:hypothetical protein ALC57_06760 [Trachymyrmex cornetzi]|uniref:Uncharacterized protein n=1 Tax=Trachymyrmex cornetzi TaxID=471704 RepID=A0A195E7Q2_9HYME|nr:hypothetical protein ALC57_06760 [Trachymyrmex cornetzi]